MEDAVVVIPARLGSTRLPNKPLIPVAGVPLIVRTVRAVKAFAPNVIVATDSHKVKELVNREGVEAVITPSDLPSGTDRVYEAVKDLPYPFIVNVQGDEPFVEEGHVLPLYRALKEGCLFSTVATPFRDLKEVENPNRVKVVLDKEFNAIYFSRSPIPFIREGDRKPEHYLKHVGIYGFRKEALEMFVNWPVGRLEGLEKLEQLRILENGYKIRVSVVEREPLGIDTPEDLEKAEKILKRG
ncbi:MAG: 3-deoxy-manno-octulosonate cytidylyltransferase [Desulfurobacteriaceae bacterium]